MKDPSPRQHRQISYITQFSCEIRHIAGQENIVADGLSRIACGIIHEPLFSPNMLRKFVPGQSDLNAFTNRALVDEIHCDTSLPGTNRPILAENLRRKAFVAVHNLHHPGSKATYELLHTRVIWPKMRRDVKLWCSQCEPCQQHKITRHIKAPIMRFPTGNRFDVVHVDLVGPLPVDRGYQYLMTMIDRKTRWFEAIPLKTMSAEIVASKFISEWIAR